MESKDQTWTAEMPSRREQPSSAGSGARLASNIQSLKQGLESNTVVSSHAEFIRRETNENMNVATSLEHARKRPATSQKATSRPSRSEQAV
jgi:hypothetical protein